MPEKSVLILANEDRGDYYRGWFSDFSDDIYVAKNIPLLENNLETVQHDVYVVTDNALDWGKNPIDIIRKHYSKSFIVLFSFSVKDDIKSISEKYNLPLYNEKDDNIDDMLEKILG